MFLCVQGWSDQMQDSDWVERYAYILYAGNSGLGKLKDHNMWMYVHPDRIQTNDDCVCVKYTLINMNALKNTILHRIIIYVISWRIRRSKREESTARCTWKIGIENIYKENGLVEHKGMDFKMMCIWGFKIIISHKPCI